MTNKEFFTAIILANLSDEITAKAQHLLEKNEEKSAKRTAQTSANKTANLEIAQKIADSIGIGRTFAVKEITSDFAEYSTAKLTAILKAGVENNIFEASDGYKVGGKGRAVRGYTVLSVTTETNEDTAEDTAEDMAEVEDLTIDENEVEDTGEEIE